jgi:hypothetical protein
MSIVKYHSYDKETLASEWNSFYEEKKSFDTNIAFENLVDLMNVLTDSRVPSFIMFGTLLGIVRNGTIIKHDSDVDIGYFDNDLNNLISAHKKLISKGFRLLREFDYSELRTYERNGEYVDLYKFSSLDQRPVNFGLSVYFPKYSILPLKTKIIQKHVIYVPNKSSFVLKNIYGFFYFIEKKNSHYPQNKLLIKTHNLLFRFFPNLDNSRIYKTLKMQIKKFIRLD